eukprot:994981_1
MELEMHQIWQIRASLKPVIPSDDYFHGTKQLSFPEISRKRITKIGKENSAIVAMDNIFFAQFIVNDVKIACEHNLPLETSYSIVQDNTNSQDGPHVILQEVVSAFQNKMDPTRHDSRITCILPIGII